MLCRGGVLKLAKIKLMRFELIALISESKRLIEYLQHVGATQIERTENEQLGHFETEKNIFELEQKRNIALNASSILEEQCKLKKPFLQSFSDYTEMTYEEYKDICSQSEDSFEICKNIVEAKEKISELKTDNIRCQTLIDYYRPWENLDIPMSSTGTAQTSIFIGFFKSQLSSDEIKAMIAREAPEFEGYEAEIISTSKIQTCCLIICHSKDASVLDGVLRKIGFIKPDNPAKKLPKKAIEELEKKIEFNNSAINSKQNDISQYSDKFDKIRFLSDFYTAEIDKCRAFSLVGATQNTIYIEGYVPERISEEIKFNTEKDFTAQMELFEPDTQNDDVPVLIESSAFAGGVENISNMYSPPSNNDVDPNPIMAFFYYSLFGLMLSDAGYGLLMVIFGLVAKYKIKVQGSMRKTADFAFIWGALFGSWFGDLIPTICTTFFGMENPPNLVIWFDPKEESMKLLLFSFLFGIIHLFAGLAIRFYNLCKHHDFIGAVCDVVPIYVFITGFAIIGKNFIDPVSDKTIALGKKLLLAGAILVVLTAGRSAKNVLGKLGGGLYGLYNTTTGYLGDILSYSRLLALNLVTGVIAIVVNLLAAMPKNIFIFILIFVIGHSINFAINLIGTYVHTNRLQYVEYFSKFYEGGGRSFTPFKINSKYIKFKVNNE